jgi:hypothetical protein
MAEYLFDYARINAHLSDRNAVRFSVLQGGGNSLLRIHVPPAFGLDETAIVAVSQSAVSETDPMVRNVLGWEGKPSRRPSVIL